MNVNQIVQRGGGIIRGSVGIGVGLGRRLASGGWGLIQEARHVGQKPKPEMDDVTLAHKVESEIFRGRSALKSAVNVNVVDGVVWLRGEVKRADQIRSLEQKARSVPEVRDVENVLHLVKTPAPTRADTPRRQQRTRSSTRRPAPRRRSAGRVSDDRTDELAPQAEPSPAERARTGEGRSPAPLGASGEGEQVAAARGEGEQPAVARTEGEQHAAARIEPEPGTTGDEDAATGGNGSQEDMPSVATPAPTEAGMA